MDYWKSIHEYGPAIVTEDGNGVPLAPPWSTDVTLYNRTKGFEKTAQFANWMTTSQPNRAQSRRCTSRTACSTSLLTTAARTNCT